MNLALGIVLFDPKPHTGGDNASYIFLAESILDLSSPYADNITPGEVKPHTQYPFGYPLILAPVVAVFGRNVVALKALSLLMIALCVVFTALLFRKKLSPWAALVLTLAVAVNPALIELRPLDTFRRSFRRLCHVESISDGPCGKRRG